MAEGATVSPTYSLHESYLAAQRNNQHRLRGEQVRLLYVGLWQPVLASVLAAILLVAAMWPLLDPALLLGWLGAILGVSLLRLWLARRFHRQPIKDQHQPRWLWHFASAAILAGVAWGAASLLLFTSEHHGQVAALTIVLAGIAAGGVTTLSSVGWVAQGFVLPILLPLLVQYVRVGTPLAILIAMMVALFLCLVLVASRRLNHIIRDNIGLHVAMTAREKQLLESESRYRSIFHHSPLGVLHYDADGILVDCNEKLQTILGVRRGQLLGLNLLGSVTDKQIQAAVRESLAHGVGYYEGDYQVPTMEESTPLRAFLSGVRSMSGEIVGGVAIVEDFTERKRAEAIIHQQAYYDSLTGLPNRRLLVERLQEVLAARQPGDAPGMLMFLDLDRFKMINDSLGHASGDDLLVQVARRLDGFLADSDLAARLSGDEFVVLIVSLGVSGEAAEKVAQQRAEQVLASLLAPYRLGERWVEVTPSIGYTCFEDTDNDDGEILKQADIAMYRAKTTGRARLCLYRPEMQAVLEQRISLERDLREALARQALTLYYQPQVDAQGCIIGAEALLRWFHPQHGAVPPQQVINIAEESDLIAELESWVIGEVCRCLKQLSSKELPRLSLNISARHFSQAEFVARVERLLAEADIDAARLTLELTESVLIDDLVQAVEKMQRLKKLGVGIAIDDFGTGYSSLSYLRRLPVDELKVDRSFIEDIDQAPKDTAIIEAIFAVARHLGLRTIAEGVNSKAQCDFLIAQGCLHFQGFGMYRPMPWDDLVRLCQR